jgi:PAS domain S-box-containing protein
LDKYRKENEPVQSSYRLSRELRQKFQDCLKREGLKMNSVVRDLILSWVEDKDDTPRTEASSPHVEELRGYLHWLPVVALVKGLRGRILFANPEFLKLIEPEADVIGKRPEEYLKDSRTAQLIEECDKLAQKEGQPVVFVEHLLFGGKTHHRMAIRFPIPPQDEAELTGAVSFDLDQVRRMSPAVDPDSTTTKPRELPTHDADDLTQVYSGGFLTRFVHSLPAAAAVQDVEGKFLCVNDRYTELAGKNRRDIQNRASRDIWPPEFADVMMLHGELVIQTEKSFVSVEKIPTSSGPVDWLNIRFPIFDEQKKLYRTGTLGFDYAWISKIIDKALDQLPDGEPPSALVYSPKENEFHKVDIPPKSAAHKAAH